MDQIFERAIFFKNSLLDLNVGAIAKSSRYVIRHVLKRLPPHLDRVIEYGPGDGALTLSLLERISPNGRLTAIEANRRFVETLSHIRDHRLTVLHGTVQDCVPDQIARLGPADAVVSSIPFFQLQPQLREKIIADTHRLLAPGGRFIIFHQYRLIALDPVRTYFKNVSVDFEPRNILPCFIIEARK